MAADLTLCGLRVRSEPPLPELAVWSGDPARPVDVEIRLGSPEPVPANAVALSPMLALRPPGKAWLSIPSVGDFQVRDGREVVVASRIDPASAELRAFLLGSIFGLICHQRRLFPLHASAIAWNGRAVAFAGPSGAGKSTLAALLCARGARLLADDVTVVDVDAQDGPLVLPSFARLKLWRDSLETLGEDVATLERNRPAQEKYHWRLGADGACLHPVPLDALYLLERAGPGRPARIETLVAAPAGVIVLHGQIYRRDAGEALGRSADLFGDAAALAGRIAVKRFVRDLDGPLAWTTDALVEDLATCPA